MLSVQSVKQNNKFQALCLTNIIWTWRVLGQASKQVLQSACLKSLVDKLGKLVHLSCWRQTSVDCIRKATK